jgi:hypothetical protein
MANRKITAASLALAPGELMGEKGRCQISRSAVRSRAATHQSQDTAFGKPSMI